MNNTNTKNTQSERENLSQSTQYEFDKNTFIVEPVFKEDSHDTLSTVLLRLTNNSS